MVAQESDTFTEFKVNTSAHYNLPTKWNKKLDLSNITKLKIYVDENDFFEARNINVFTHYTLTFFNANLISKWLSKCDMTFYQNQLNFAVWCATSGCGVAVKHLTHNENLISSVFRFHVYYQTRKILEEMSCPIPDDPIFSTTDNHINMLKYQKLCNEFNISPSADFRFKGGENGGLGTMYNYATHLGYRRVSWRQYNPKTCGFIQNSTNEVLKIDYVKQDAATDGWKQFILEDSEGFTRAGAIRIDDSIRNYVHCVLGSQAQTRSSILKSLETQQYFTDLLEQNVKSMFSIPESITKYQDAISKTNSRIDYVVAQGLYMIPSDLVLKVGTLVGYNNNIVIASTNMKLGHNDRINQVQLPVPYKTSPAVPEPPVQDHEITIVPSIYAGLGASVLVLLVLYLL
jgi:hypothetical protein